MGGLLSAAKEMKLEDDALNQNVEKMYVDYDSYSNDKKSDMVLFCKVDRMYEKDKKRLTLAVRDPQFRIYLTTSMQTTNAKRKYGRAPATHMERELQEWVEHLLM